MKIFKNILFNISCALVLVLGVILRTRFYINNGIFEDDECRLAYSMIGRNLLDMFGPLGPWSSSPIFMFISKIVANLSNYNEYALEFLPYLFSIISIYFFYKITSKYFDRKILVIISNFFFAVNNTLIYFSATFKQYSLELLLGLICLYYFPKIDLITLSWKKLTVLAIFIAILPVCSLPSLFFIAAFICINWMKNIKNTVVYKKIGYLLIPVFIIMIIYYIYNLAPTKFYQTIFYGNMWNEFFSYSLQSVLYMNFSNFFSPNPYLLFMMILLVTAIIIYFSIKEKRKDIDLYCILTFFFTVLASELHLYPYMTRASIFVIPLLIYLMLKPLDILKIKSFMFFLFLFFTMIAFYRYFTPSFFKSVYNIHEKFVIYSPDKLMKTIKKDFSLKSDKIIVNEASSFSFIYYVRKNNFLEAEQTMIVPDINQRFVKNSAYECLNNLDPNYNYWFYLIKDYREHDRIYIQQWLKNQNIEKSEKDKSSYLYYIKPPYKKVQL